MRVVVGVAAPTLADGSEDRHSSQPTASAEPEPPPSEAEPELPAPEWARLYSQARVRYRERQEDVEREQQEAQRLWEEFLGQQGEQVPEGERSLERNEELHQQLKRLARTAAAQLYEREDVIGDPHQTFGVEIEFDGADPNLVARALYEAGLASSPYQESYHSHHRQPGKWTVERDVTVGGELVSPVLRDTPETWAQLERVCSILNAHGARTSIRTGGHVHVGADSANLDHDVDRFRRVAQVCAWAEDLIYRLAAGSGRGGRRHRGAGRGYRWCGPMRPDDLERARDLDELAYRVGTSHSVGLNFGNILQQRRTIEYRYFDSSLDPGRIQANVKLACWLTKRAGELQDSTIPRERMRLGTHASQPDERDSLLRRFADLVFVRPQDKLRLYGVYERSAWQQPA
ncbi:MAG: amidoligase family protein [Candidatus Dormibacteraeota bacterium]|nr:amidoligase family protein [Candidatus Dormibacteraeota bacterium]